MLDLETRCSLRYGLAAPRDLGLQEALLLITGGGCRFHLGGLSGGSRLGEGKGIAEGVFREDLATLPQLHTGVAAFGD